MLATKIPLAVPAWGQEEINEAIDSLTSGMLTMGRKVKRFEEMWAEYIGVKHAVMVNSGSSANLLALSALGLKPGDEVITPALTWATTVFPIAQVGAVPVLVDVDLDTYNIDPQAMEDAITPRTVAVMPVHLLGNPCSMGRLIEITDGHDLDLIEDACEAHGAEYKGQKMGSLSGGTMGTFSFFFSHHISTIEGGMIVTNLDHFEPLIRSLRAFGWAREVPHQEYPGIDPRFLFLHAGYNFRPTEIQGAFGIHQVPRLEGFIEHRRWLADYWNENLKEYEEFLILPYERPGTRHARFAYPFLLRPGCPFTKEELQQHLESKGVESRQIEAGNMAIQPAMEHINHRISGSLTNAEYIHNNAFFIGCHHGIGQAEREAVVEYVQEFLAKYRGGKN